MSKVKTAYAILTSCTGCKITLLDTHEKLLDILDKVDLVYSHMVQDAREIPDDCDLIFIEGSVSTDEDYEEALALRKKAKYVVAVGSCACFGGIPSLRNFYDTNDILESTYQQRNSIYEGPNKLLPKVQALSSVIEVNFEIPGCPPLPKNFLDVINNFPNFEKIKLPTKTLCVECKMRKEKLLSPIREFTSLKINDPNELDDNSDLCFLERGVICMGIATRSGCGGRCVGMHIPCRGCFGPPPQEGSEDQGAGLISAISSILPIGRLMAKEDILGMVYRYSMSVITDLQGKTKGGNCK